MISYNLGMIIFMRKGKHIKQCHSLPVDDGNLGDTVSRKVQLHSQSVGDVMRLFDRTKGQ